MKSGILSGIIAVALLATLIVPVGTVMAKEMGKGWIPYRDVVVTWDGVSAYGDWYVWTSYPGGTKTGGCDDCLEMIYEFECVGNTLQFDEVYVEVVPAYPQTHHVVLLDIDGDGTYTGSITARYDWPIGYHRMDVIEYEITVDGACQVTDFFYVENEYRQQQFIP